MLVNSQKIQNWQFLLEIVYSSLYFPVPWFCRKDSWMNVKNSVPESFQKCLASLMEKRSLSSGQLAEMMQYKSKTTLLRVLQGKAGIRCIGNVYADLCRCEALELTDAETDMLHVAYEVEVWGLDTYRARSEMWRLLRKSEHQQQSMQILMGSNVTTLETLLNSFVPCTEPLPENGIPVEQLEVCILSGGYSSLVNALSSLLKRMGSRIHVTQLLQLTGDIARTVRLIRNILPILGYHTYEIYFNRQEDISPDPIYSYSGTGRAMILKALLPDGSTREFQILLRDEISGVLLESPGLWEHWMQYAASYMEQMQPLKAVQPDMTDYVRMLEYYADTEKNREALIYKEDISFHHIPTDILLHALLDSGHSAEMLDVVPKLRSIQEKRFHNVMAKRQHTHWVASAEALRRFARTGVQNDHFFAMRPFTREERLRIFRNLLHMLEENPYFHLYLMRPEDEDSFVDLEATYLEGVGLQLTPSETDYRITDGWTETMLTEESFCALYKEFFMEELIGQHTCPTEDSVVLLQEIIQQLQEEK